MSAKSAAAAYEELDRLASARLLSKGRKAARRVNWRAYAVWAKGYRKKFFSCFSKAREYWNQIKRLGSVPTIQSWRYKKATTTCTTVSVPIVPVVRPTPRIAIDRKQAITLRPIYHSPWPSKWMPVVNFFRTSPYAPPALAASAAVLGFFASFVV